MFRSEMTISEDAQVPGGVARASVGMVSLLVLALMFSAGELGGEFVRADGSSPGPAARSVESVHRSEARSITQKPVGVAARLAGPRDVGFVLTPRGWGALVVDGFDSAGFDFGVLAMPPPAVG